MITPIEALILTVRQSPNEVLTKANVLHTLRNMLETEQEHLEAMADASSSALKHFGVRGFSGKEIFERRYRGIVNKSDLV
jgi:hypothetical protein